MSEANYEPDAIQTKIRCDKARFLLQRRLMDAIKPRLHQLLKDARLFVATHRTWVIRGSIAAAVLVAIGIAFSLMYSPTVGGIPKELQVRETDWVLGDPTKAKVTLIEYSDFECPGCGIYYSVLKQLKAEAGDDLLVVYRHFPLSAIHPNAEIAAQAAEAAGMQGKFFQMHDKLFENQKEWIENSEPRTIIIGYSKELKLDEERFIDDMDSGKVARKISRSVDEARSLGAKGTPSFFLNGILQPNATTFAEFKQDVLREIYGDSH